MISAAKALWPPATGPDLLGRAGHRALPAHGRDHHDARGDLAGARGPFPAQALDLARQLYEAIERRVDALGRPARPDILCAKLRGHAPLMVPPRDRPS